MTTQQYGLCAVGWALYDEYVKETDPLLEALKRQKFCEHKARCKDCGQ